MGIDSLDFDRVENYFRDILNRSAPVRADVESWRRLLLNTDLLAESGGSIFATVAGLLLAAGSAGAAVPDESKFVLNTFSFLIWGARRAAKRFIRKLLGGVHRARRMVDRAGAAQHHLAAKEAAP